MASAIIVFSHLRWDFVFQRPQHLLSRLAAHYPIVFIEEPMQGEEDTFFKTYSPAPNIIVCQPCTPAGMPGFHDEHLPHLRKLLRQIVHDYEDHIAWFYTPMALPLLQELQPKLVVYDCMDELSAFKNAPKQLLQRESALLKVADLVFTGGQSLYRAKRDRHPNVHCFPSSVDTAHFLQALDRSNSHPAHRDIAGPRLGFYGVIDERFDIELIAKVADAHAQWQIVLVGPVAKIEPESLPRRSNIHYLGQQPYEALPHFLAGWDVCLLPFALNESTRYISPTKTLEYMAAELPIVSTPVTDVAEIYGDIVAIAGDAESFIAACEAALLASPEQHAATVQKMRKVLAATSWKATAEQMRHLLETTPRRQAEAARPAAVSAAVAEAVPNVNRLRRQDALRFVNTAIIGAGPTGLSAAYHLGHDVMLFDRNQMVGGSCRSVRDKGFTFDCSGDIMLSGDPYVLELVDILLGSNVRWQECGVAVYGEDAGALQGLRHLGLHRLPPEFADGSRTRFGYPSRGGVQSLMSAFVPHIKGTIELNADVIQVLPKQRVLTLADGRRYQYDNLVSTVPLPELVAMAGDEAPDEVRQAAEALRHVSVRCVHLGIARENVTDKHWIYFPEQNVLFHRVFAQGNASAECSPPGSFGLTCEIFHSPGEPLAVSGQDLVRQCVRDCIRAGLLREEDRIVVSHETDLSYVYVSDDAARADNVSLIRNWLSLYDIVTAGHFGEWQHNDASGHAFVAGKKAAEAVKWMERKSAAAAE
jgi:protoporphyrinogen oxidase/glycosyltransferase involved in cell wall biosynthesis